MKKRLFMLLAWLICVSALAQKTIDLPYREGNTNTLDMSVYFSGQPVKPGNSLSVVAELRGSDQGRVIASIPLTAVDTSAGLMTGPLPYLQPNIYYLGLYFRYSSGVQFRVGVSRVNIRPAGSLNSTPDATGLNVQISEQKVVPNIYLDATPSSSIAAYYANQARTAVRDSIAAFSQLQDNRDNNQDTQINARLTVNTYTSNRTADLNLIGQKLNIADSTAFQRKRTGWDLSQNNYSSAEKLKLAGLPASVPDLATYTSDQNAQNTAITANAATTTNHITNTSNPHGTTATQVGAYTTSQIDSKLLQYTAEYLVNTYADAVTLATGTDEKIFKVKADTDGCYSEYRYKNTSPEKDHLIFTGPYSCQKFQ